MIISFLLSSLATEAHARNAWSRAGKSGSNSGKTRSWSSGSSVRSRYVMATESRSSQRAKRVLCSPLLSCRERGRLDRSAARRPLGRAAAANGAESRCRRMSHSCAARSATTRSRRGRPATCFPSPTTLDAAGSSGSLRTGDAALGRGEPRGRRDAAAEALALWRGAALCRVRARALGAGRGRAARGVAAPGARGPDRRRSRGSGRTPTVVGELEALVASIRCASTCSSC